MCHLVETVLFHVKKNSFIFKKKIALDCFPQGEFSWDANTQALVLGSFFYGYIVTQVTCSALLHYIWLKIEEVYLDMVKMYWVRIYVNKVRLHLS